MPVLGGLEDIWVAVLAQGEDIWGVVLGGGRRFGLQVWRLARGRLGACFTGEARNLVVASDKLD